MFEVELIDLETNKRFTKTFWNEFQMRNFVRKCKYSKKVKVIGITDNTKFFD